MRTKIRVRLSFDNPPLPSPAENKDFMLLVNRGDVKSISDVEDNVAKKFGIGNSHSLSLSMDGYTLIPNEDVEVIRDGDKIYVKVSDNSQALSHSHEEPSVHETAVKFSTNSSIIKLSKKRASCDGDADELPKKVAKIDATEKTTTPKKATDSCKNLRVVKSNITNKKKHEGKKNKKKYNKLSIAVTKEIKAVKKNTPAKEKHSKKRKASKKIKKVKTSVKKPVAKPTLKKAKKSSRKGKKGDVSTPSNGTIISPLSQRTRSKSTSGATAKENTSSSSRKKKLKVKFKKFKKSKNFLNQEAPEIGKQGHEKEVNFSGSFSLASVFDHELKEESISEPSSVARDYDLLKTLYWPPKIGDLIAFKLLEMSDNYTPQISSFMEACIEEIDGESPATAVLKVEILWPNLVSQSAQSSETSHNLKNTKVVSWSCLIEPKLIA